MDTLTANKEILLQLCGPESEYEVIEFNNMEPASLGYVTLKKDFFTKVNLKINQDTKNYFIILIKKGEDSNAYVTQSKGFLWKDKAKLVLLACLFIFTGCHNQEKNKIKKSWK